MNKPIIDLQPVTAIAGMSSLAGQMDALSKFVITSQPGLNLTLQTFGREFADLMLITDSRKGLVDSLAAALPKIDLAAHLGVTDVLAASAKSLGEALAPSIDISSLAAAMGSDMLTLQTVFAELGKTTELMTSDVFVEIQKSLGVGTQFEISVPVFMNSIAADNGAELKEIIGESHELNVTLDVLSHRQTVDDLPQNLKNNFEWARKYTYDHGLVIAALILWVFRIIRMFQERNVEAASEWVEALVILLLILQHMAEKDRQK